MRKIMVFNPKGGSGKTTISTNLASYYATQGQKVILVDLDKQQSSMDWLYMRADRKPHIQGLSGNIEEIEIPNKKGVMIFDTPAGVDRRFLKKYAKTAHTIIIPILPSPLDMRATARFISDLLLVGRISREKTKVAVIGNRVKERTRIFKLLQRFLNSLDIPFITNIRETQNYIRCVEVGAGIFEMPVSMVKQDLEQWEPLVNWLDSEQSQPKLNSFKYTMID